MVKKEEINNRIKQVITDYQGFHFTPLMDETAKAFLDLALEYQDLPNFCYLSVSILKMVLNWDSALYIRNDYNSATLKASTEQLLSNRLDSGETINAPLIPELIIENGEYRFPLHQGDQGVDNENATELDISGGLGVLVVFPQYRMKEQEIFFVQKYAGLVGISVVQRLFAGKNIQHIQFIKKLVADIGHNVIVPNIFFKAYLRRLKGKINRLEDVQRRLRELADSERGFPESTILNDLAEEMANANEGLFEEFDHIQKHYVNTSLFLETLLRQGHFEQGQYVLKKRPCNFRKDIILPQIERLKHRLNERDIKIDLSAGGVPDESIEAVVDVGLISQVYSNLLSNAVKYTRSVPEGDSRKKFIAYGLQVIPNAFGEGKNGVKLNLFSSGPPLPREEQERIFSEGYRGSNIEEERGTGHGLFFVKEVVELHGGYAGHEATEKGNNFFFILPV